MQRSAQASVVVSPQIRCAPADARRYASTLMMKTFLMLLALLIGSTSGSAVPAKNTFQFVAKKAGHTAKITFTTKLFIRSAHRIVRTSTCLRIDGREPLGTDCNVPTVEIESLRFFFDGKEVGVPERLYADCYQPPFINQSGRVMNEGDVDNYFAARISDDLQSVFVFMWGGDAAGSYQVIWVLRKDGRHTRFSGACSDCGFIDFHGGFFQSN
jgi:hypothetical protein